MHPDLIRDYALAGRAAVVTGAASGIGRATALVLAQAGAKVMLADVDEAGLADAAAEIAELQAKVETRRTDVGVRAEVEALADAALAGFGTVHIWVNVAGIMARGTILEMDETTVDRLIAVNQKGVYWGIAAAGRILARHSGAAIVNVSSGGGESGTPGISVYAMTKAAVNIMTKTAAKEFGPLGIRVNVVAPGYVETPLASDIFRDASGAVDPVKRETLLAQRTAVSPLGITGEPRDIALAIHYLACDASRFVTGQIVRPNGGVAMP